MLTTGNVFQMHTGFNVIQHLLKMYHKGGKFAIVFSILKYFTPEERQDLRLFSEPTLPQRRFIHSFFHGQYFFLKTFEEFPYYTNVHFSVFQCTCHHQWNRRLYITILNISTRPQLYVSSER